MSTLWSDVDHATADPLDHAEAFSLSRSWWIGLDDYPEFTFTPGTEVFQQGGCPEAIYVIRSGLVKLVHLGPGGRETIVGLRSRGWPLGAASAILEKHHLFQGIALTRSRLTRIPASEFCDLARTNSDLGWRLLLAHCLELYDGYCRLADMEHGCARDRLERFLIRVAAIDCHADPHKRVRVQLPLKHWEIAQLVGVTPSYLSQLLTQLAVDGVIIRHNGWIVIPDPTKLQVFDEY